MQGVGARCMGRCAPWWPCGLSHAVKPGGACPHLCLERLIGGPLAAPDHKEENSMTLTEELTFVGIDVGKTDLVLAFDSQAQVFTFMNNAEGHAAIVDLLAQRPARVVFEATGGYEWPLWEALDAAGVAARQVAPAQVRAFARCHGAWAKTDALDARILAAFAAFRPQAGREISDKYLRDLRALVTCRRARVTDLTRLSGRADKGACKLVSDQQADLRALLKAQIKALDHAIAEAIARDQDLATKAQLLRSIPGIGSVLSATLLVEMPELGTLTNKAVASLTGTAPMARDSGAWRGHRFICGGRKTVRDVLWMGAAVAARHNPDLRIFFERLRARELPHKKAIIAVARKLIVLANTVLKRKSPWVKLQT